MKYQIGNKAEFTKTISESDVYLFAGITGDLNPIHVNEIEAANSQFGNRLVHGILVTGLISSVIGMKFPGPGTIYMEQQIKFLKPVMIGDTVTAVVELTKVLNEEKRIMELSTEVFNQKKIKVLEGKAVVKAPEA